MNEPAGAATPQRSVQQRSAGRHRRGWPRTSGINAVGTRSCALLVSGDAAHIMAEMVDVKVSGAVRAAPDKVFRFLADLENWPRWQSDMQTTTLVDGQPGQPGARYRYVSKAVGRTFDSTVRVVRAEPPREVAFEGEWAGMIRPSGRYLIEPAPEGARVTLNPHRKHEAWGRSWLRSSGS